MRRSILPIALFVLFVGTVCAEDIPTAIAAGTAGAGVSTIRGGDARWVNPALLGLSGNPPQSILLPSFGYRLGNTALKTSLMNSWFRADRYWTQSERNTMVNSLSGDFEMLGKVGGGLGYQMQNYVFAVDFVGALDAGVPNKVVALMVNGNQPGAHYYLNGIHGGGWGGMAFGVSTAKTFKDVTWAQEFSAGITARYIIGLSYMGIRTSQGQIYTNINPDTVSLQGNIVSAHSSKGDGISFDVGVAARQDSSWGWSFSILNIVGKMAWDGVQSRANTFAVNAQGIPIDSLTKDGFLEHWSNYHSTDISSGNTENTLPPVILAAGDYKYDEEWRFLGCLEQGLTNTKSMIGGTTRTKWSFGSEYSRFATVPLRAGFALGGDARFELQVGAGLRLDTYQLDVATGFERGLFYGAKGFSLAISQRILLDF